MGQLHLISLSEAAGNDIDAQRWMLSQMSRHVDYLCKVTHTTRDGTYDDLSLLITKLCNLYAATGCDYRKVDELLQAKLDEAESQYDPESIKEVQKEWAERPHQFGKEVFELEMERGEELSKRPMRSFFRPTR